MQETINTCVIYMITNTVNSKMYIGRTVSFQHHGVKPPTKHGAHGRFKGHWSKVNSGNNEIPLLYADMHKYGKSCFEIKALEVCHRDDVRARETYHIRQQRSFENDIGYNLFIGDKKPEDIAHKKAYENRKSDANKSRAADGALRRSVETTQLPPNIYKRKQGIFAQIKLPIPNGNSTLYNKAFFISSDSDEIKLNKALNWLEQIKQTHQKTINV